MDRKDGERQRRERLDAGGVNREVLSSNLARNALKHMFFKQEESY